MLNRTTMETFYLQLKKVLSLLEESYKCHNGELLGAYGNFVNRTLKFVEKYYEGIIPDGKVDLAISKKIESLYEQIGQLIENAHFKQALEEIFEFVRFANKYFDEKEPWKQLRENKAVCDGPIYNCVHLIANLAQLLLPFLPFSSEKIKRILSIDEWKWEHINISPFRKINKVTPLFERIDIKRIDEERVKLIQGV